MPVLKRPAEPIIPPTHEPKHKEMNSHVFARNGDDWYIEDSWVTRALLLYRNFSPLSVLDPFCGTGRILHVAAGMGYDVHGCDVVNRLGDDIAMVDSFNMVDAFTLKDLFKNDDEMIISNPPYDRVNELLQLIAQGIAAPVCLFMPLQYISGKARFLQKCPLSTLLVLTPRPNCLPGQLIAEGVKPQGGKRDFAWYLFEPGVKAGGQWSGWLLGKNGTLVEGNVEDMVGDE